MASSARTLFFVAAFFLFNVALASEKKDQPAAAVPAFNYSKPIAWGAEDPKFSVCSSGKRQSPIDIVTTAVVLNNTLQPLTRNYHVTEAKVTANGIAVEVLFKGQGGVVIDGKNYNLAQMHWHTPSEHRLNGVQYAAEQHIVHVAADGSKAVVGILYKIGSPSPVLQLMKPQLDELAKKPCEGEEPQIIVPKFESMFLRKRPRYFYRYLGSLTTPPCDENVVWTVLSKVKTISQEQVDALRAPACEANKKNARPIQPLNERVVQQYQEQ